MENDEVILEIKEDILKTKIRNSSSVDDLKSLRKNSFEANRWSSDKILTKVDMRINRIIAFLYQLQQNVKPDKWICILSIFMFSVIFAENLMEYHDMNTISFILNYVLLILNIIFFIYQLYTQFTFSLRYRIKHNEWIIVKNNSIYEIQVLY